MSISSSSTSVLLKALVMAIVWASILVLSSPTLKAQLVDIATNATDPSNLADTEPSIAVNPANHLEIVIVSFSEGWGPGNPGPIWRSTDGGTTWTKLFVLPQPNPSSFSTCDQKVAFDASGNLHVAQLGCGMSPPRCMIFRQTGAPGTALTFGALYGDDQPHLDMDHFAMSAFLGRLYSPWMDFSASPNPRSMTTRSANGGSSVTNVGVGDNGSFPNRTTRVAIASDGKVYVIFKTREGSTSGGFENAHFRVRRSDDGGVNWNALGATGVSVHGSGAVETWFTSSWGNAAKGKVARARSSDAWIAVDPGSGEVYAAYVKKDDSGFGQIYVARSKSLGASWSSTRVTDGTHHSAFPEIAVAQNGTVGVLYVDFDDSGASTIFRHRFARSFNGGTTWSNANLQSMDPGPIGNATSGFLWGDYEGLTAAGNTFYGVFTGQSIGRTTLQLDPIFFRRTAWQIGINPCITKPWLCTLAVMKPNLIKLECPFPDCRVIDPIPRNCLVKFDCPGCAPNGLCPPFYNIFLDGMEDNWRVQLLDPAGKVVNARQVKTATGTVVSFRPAANHFRDGKIDDYHLVFSLGPKGKVKTPYEIKTRLEASNKPFRP